MGVEWRRDTKIQILRGIDRYHTSALGVGPYLANLHRSRGVGVDDQAQLGQAHVRPRCPWVDLSKPDYVAYHDREWGVPVHDDRLQFEFLILEGAQAGLSWYTVLRRRESYRAAFDGFDPEKVALYDETKVAELLADPGIIRNRAKVAAAVNNARRFLEVTEERGSFAAYLWDFVDGRPIVNELHTLDDYAATSPESEALSRDLKRRGFAFVGPTIVYAHMQATGMVNDHTVDCFCREKILAGSRRLTTSNWSHPPTVPNGAPGSKPTTLRLPASGTPSARRATP